MLSIISIQSDNLFLIFQFKLLIPYSFRIKWKWNKTSKYKRTIQNFNELTSMIIQFKNTILTINNQVILNNCFTSLFNFDLINIHISHPRASFNLNM